MKKYFALLCACALLLCMAGCDELTVAETPDTTDPLETAVVALETATPTPANGMVEVTLYFGDESCDTLLPTKAHVQDNLQAVLTALLQDARYPVKVQGEIELLSATTATEQIERDGKMQDAVVLHLDVSRSVAKALATSGTAGEVLAIYGLADTMLTYARADALILTSEGMPIETGHAIYDTPLFFDTLDAAAQADEYTNAEIKVYENGKVAYTKQLQSADEIAALSAIVLDYMVKSAAWDAVEVSELESYIVLSFDWTAVAERQSYVGFLLNDQPMLQSENYGRYTAMSGEAYDKLTALAAH